MSQIEHFYINHYKNKNIYNIKNVQVETINSINNLIININYFTWDV